MSVIVKVAWADEDDPGVLPAYKTDGAACMDLFAHNKTDVTLWPGDSMKIPTGLCFEIPENYEGQVRSRSGLATSKGIIVLNAPGTIDADYRGELQVLLQNTSRNPVVISRGDRIAQITFKEVPRTFLSLVKKENLSQTGRGAGGFGSTGV